MLVRFFLACFIVPLALGLPSASALAQDTMYKCVDEHGSTIFTNTDLGSFHDCKKLAVDPQKKAISRSKVLPEKQVAPMEKAPRLAPTDPSSPTIKERGYAT
jgi:hypothetical protein